jgi:hypothetical protein
MTFVTPRPRKKKAPREPVFPESRNLFLFLRQVLAHRRGVPPSQIRSYEIGFMIIPDHKAAHQFRFGYRQVTDVEELRIFSEKLNIPYFIVAKVAMGLWDPEKAFQFLLQWEKEKLVEIEKEIRGKDAVVHVKFRILPQWKDEIQSFLKKLEGKVVEWEDNPEIVEKAVSHEMEMLMDFLAKRDLPVVTYAKKKEEKEKQKEKGSSP